jgi:uncharacterized protein
MVREQILPGVWLDSRRAVFFEELSLLAIADLHWGYAQSHRASGNLLPLWGDDRIARELNELIESYQPREMLWLGDSLHDLNGRASAERFLAEARCEVTLVLGNHDARWKVGRDREVRRANFFFHHGNNAAVVEPGVVEVIGHFSSRVRLVGRSGSAHEAARPGAKRAPADSPGVFPVGCGRAVDGTVAR